MQDRRERAAVEGRVAVEDAGFRDINAPYGHVVLGKCRETTSTVPYCVLA